MGALRKVLLPAGLLAALPLGLALQGRYVRRVTPRLPGAAGPASGSVAGAAPELTLLVLGESTVAGVGAPDHQQALTGQLARALSGHTGRAVRWHAVGQIGASARVVRRSLVAALPALRPDLIVIALGVNDVLELRSPRQWADDLTALIAALRARLGPAPVLLMPVPPMGRFPALPQPLRGTLGLHARALERAALRLAPQLDRVRYGALSMPAGADVTDFFCEDRFHPSVLGYQRWAAELVGQAAGLLEL